MREAPAIVLIHQLLAAGATVQAYDPVAMDQACLAFPAAFFKDNCLRLSDTSYDALNDADALVLVTEWKAFRQPSFQDMANRMRQPVIFDGRNLYDPVEVAEHGFEYHGIGREMAGKLSGE
jgi:UDPglucose 6-dehydrogenase